MALRVFIQQTVQVNVQGQQIHYAGPNPNALGLVNGALPTGSTRRWPNYGQYLEVTEYVPDIHNTFKITFTTDVDDDGVVVPGGDNRKKTATGTIKFEADAYRLIKQWLFNDVSAPLNKVDVKIEDTDCGGVYTGLQISSSDLRWCEDDTCTVDCNLKQKEEVYNCIRSTVISDNWRGEFQTQPKNGKKHPRFSYCNEIRPNGMLIAQWYFSSITLVLTSLLLLSLLPLMNVIIFIINLVNSILGTGSGNPIPYLDPSDIIESAQQQYIESAGCGREHPAPLIRDYIQSVCDKCGIKVDAVTCPIFFNPTYASPEGNFWSTSSGKAEGSNPHYNACYFNAPIERGIRRFRSFNFLGSNANDTDFYIQDNAPIEPLDQFLDRLCGLYASKWRLTYVNGEPHLYFWRKDWFLTGNNNVLFDFRQNGADRHKILQGVCFEITEKKNFASAKGLYTIDPGDSCGNEGLKHMNGLVSYGNTDENPTFEGMQDRSAQFGGTKFRLDGASTDYILDAAQVTINSAVFAGFFPGLFKDFVLPAFDEYADYALLLKDETCSLPKVILWDAGSGHMNAKAVNYYSAYNGNNNFGATPPDPNPAYNPTLTPWQEKHPPQTFVIGSSLSFGSQPPGVYLVQDYFGIDLYKKPALLINYPMYMAPEFRGGLWDFCHWIDDPKLNPKLNMGVTVTIDKCCEDLNRLKPFNDGEEVQLNAIMKVDNDYHEDALIRDIEIDYGPQTIQIKGTL